MGDLLEVQYGGDPRPVVEEVGGTEVIMDKLTRSARPAAIYWVRVDSKRSVEVRQHTSRLCDLCGVVDIKEVTTDDRVHPERDVPQLES